MRHKWDWSQGSMVATCKRKGCGCSQRFYERQVIDSRNGFTIYHLFIDKNGKTILIGRGVKIPPCEGVK